MFCGLKRGGKWYALRLAVQKGLLLFLVVWLVCLLCGCDSPADTLLGVSSDSEEEVSSQESSILTQTGEDLDSEASGSTDSESVSETEEGGSDEDESSGAQSGSSSADLIYAYICGAVESPGVYALPEGSRVYELAEAAGGLRADAAEESVNLAAVLEDGQMIQILTEEEYLSSEESLSSGTGTGTASGSSSSSETTASSSSDNSKINLNTATAEELTALNGIGEAKAAAIIAYREENGAFSSIEEIMEVDGIAEGIYEKIKDSITVD